MALTPAELENLVCQASTALQRIQDELGRDGSRGRVRFPTGYIRPVRDRIDRLNWMENNTLRRNICYHLIFADVLRWLLNRTTLTGTARSMVVKHTITTMGGIAEAITATAARQLGHGKRSFVIRVQRLCKEGAFDQALCDELIWLWEARSAIHVHEVEELELDAYDVSDSNRAIKATSTLAERIRSFVIAKEFENLEDEESWLR